MEHGWTGNACAEFARDAFGREGIGDQHARTGASVAHSHVPAAALAHVDHYVIVDADWVGSYTAMVAEDGNTRSGARSCSRNMISRVSHPIPILYP